MVYTTNLGPIWWWFPQIFSTSHAEPRRQNQRPPATPGQPAAGRQGKHSEKWAWLLKSSKWMVAGDSNWVSDRWLGFFGVLNRERKGNKTNNKKRDPLKMSDFVIWFFRKAQTDSHVWSANFPMNMAFSLGVAGLCPMISPPLKVYFLKVGHSNRIKKRDSHKRHDFFHLVI